MELGSSVRTCTTHALQRTVLCSVVLFHQTSWYPYNIGEFQGMSSSDQNTNPVFYNWNVLFIGFVCRVTPCALRGV
jgi:hypothetical protein